MKFKIKNRKEIAIHELDRILEAEGFKITVKEKYKNGVLVGQKWLNESNFHKKDYESDSLVFHYFDDISFVTDSELVFDRDWDKIPNPGMVKDWDEFKGLEHVLCIWIGMDGNIYQIDKSKPLKIWRKFGYISGFTSKNFDLEKVKEDLSKLKFTKDFEIIEVPYYNAEEDGEKALQFKYKMESEKSFRRYLEGKYPGKYFGL